jgi:hypothetical protein
MKDYIDDGPDVAVVRRWVFLETNELYALDVSVNWLEQNGILKYLTYRIAPNGDYTCVLHWVGETKHWLNFDRNVRCRVIKSRPCSDRGPRLDGFL